MKTVKVVKNDYYTTQDFQSFLMRMSEESPQPNKYSRLLPQILSITLECERDYDRLINK